MPKYLRKTRSTEELKQWLYIKGISTNDFPAAFAVTSRQRCEGILTVRDHATEVRLKKRI
jgi:hypothetical protein